MSAREARHQPMREGQKPVRTFVAVVLPQDVKQAIGSVESQFRKSAPRVRWVSPENLHITLKFLGNVDADRLSDVEAAVREAVKGLKPFRLEFRGAGAFPNQKKPRVIWIGIEGEVSLLSEAAERVDKALVDIGFEAEDRPFRGHVTIGRCRDIRDGAGVSDALRDVGALELGSMNVDRVIVMKSDLRPEGPIYSEIAEIKIEAGGQGVVG